jgi:L-lactate dehydrogenase complex protein LldE
LKAALFPTCLVDAIAPQIGVAVVRLLRRMGHEVVVPPKATCCGQPAWNAGHTEAAADVARTTLQALSAELASGGVDVIVVPAGSCATMLRVFWQELFASNGRAGELEAVKQTAAQVRELSELLDEAGLPDVTKPDATPTAYHRSCHMLRELGISDAPERVLTRTGADHRPHAGGGRCCGFGGLFSVKLPEVSTAMADDVLDAMAACGASRVVGADASCLMHLEARAQHRGLQLSFEHLAIVADRATDPSAPVASP